MSGLCVSAGCEHPKLPSSPFGTCKYHTPQPGVPYEAPRDIPPAPRSKKSSKGTLAPQKVAGGRVAAEPTVRRLRALNAIGYSASAIAKKMGIPMPTCNNMVHGKYPTVTKQNAAAAADVYDQLKDKRLGGPSRAAVLGRWKTPSEWDDIDDLEESPLTTRDLSLEDAEHPVFLGYVPWREVAPLVEEKQQQGWSLKELSEAVGRHSLYFTHALGSGQSIPESTRDQLRDLPPLDRTGRGGRFPYAAWPLTRRVRALLAMGHRLSLISHVSGVAPGTVRSLATAKTTMSTPSVDQAIRDVYEQLKNSGEICHSRYERLFDPRWKTPPDWTDIDDPNESETK